MSNTTRPTPAQKAKKAKQEKLKALRGVGHRLDPIVLIGANGLTDGVIEEINRALHDHELIKIKIPAGTGDERKAVAAEIASLTESEIAHQIGRMVLLFKKNPEPNAKLSNLARFGL